MIFDFRLEMERMNDTQIPQVLGPPQILKSQTKNEVQNLNTHLVDCLLSECVNFIHIIGCVSNWPSRMTQFDAS